MLRFVPREDLNFLILCDNSFIYFIYLKSVSSSNYEGETTENLKN